MPVTKTCPVSGQTFQVSDQEIELYKKMDVPLPDLSPIERMRSRLIFRNERNFYRRDCDATGKKMIALYPQDTDFPVYGQDYWWSDHWDPRSFGRDFDFSRPFFEQFSDLMKFVPRLSIINAKSENAQYTNYSEGNKNCYMSVGLGTCEDCHYTFRAFFCENLLDCAFMLHSQWCYECSECEHSYECTFSHRCSNSRNLQYCFDCKNCQDCFGCWNLNQKKFHIFNEPYTQEEYEKKIVSMPQVSREKGLEHVKSKAVFRASKLINCEDCSGDNIVNSQRCHHGFDMYDSQDCRYYLYGGGSKDCIDVMYCDNNELNFQSACLEKNYDIGFCYLIWYCNSMRYCMECFNSNNLFGCLSMNKAEYCILNKQYSKEEYEALVPKIIEHMKKTGEWGTYFPHKLSPFAYNQAITQVHLPLSQEEALERGFAWEDQESASKYIGEKYVIPERIEDVGDDITEQILNCEETGKHYKIQKAELDFYRNMKLAIPRIHPDLRYEKRMAILNPRKLWDRKCSECEKSVQTTYSPDRPEKILCEECYLKIIN